MDKNKDTSASDYASTVSVDKDKNVDDRFNNTAIDEIGKNTKK